MVFSVRVAAASALGAIACFELLRWLEVRLAWRTTHGAFLVLALASTAGFLVTAVLARAFGVAEIEGFLRKIQRLAG